MFHSMDNHGQNLPGKFLVSVSFHRSVSCLAGMFGGIMGVTCMGGGGDGGGRRTAPIRRLFSPIRTFVQASTSERRNLKS